MTLPANTEPNTVPGPLQQALGPTVDRWRVLAQCSKTEARALVPARVALDYNILPLNVIGLEQSKTLVVAAPFGFERLPCARDLAFVAGMPVAIEECEPATVTKAVFAAYQNNFPDEVNLDWLLNQGLTKGASDIHLEPTDGGYKLRFRVDGRLSILPDSIDEVNAHKVIRQVRVRSELDIAARDEIAEGAFSYSVPGWSIRVRASIVPQVNGDKLVLRLLDNRFLDELLSVQRETSAFSSLGLDDKQQQQLMWALGAQGGLVLVTGPTGSGKSTLLYACLEYLNRSHRSIVTVEDPVERRIAGASQIEVDLFRGHTVASLIRALMRQDPDLMLIGEIRDKEVARVALEAAMTGHLVLSSMHSGTCNDAIARLRQMELQNEAIVGSLRIIISSQLVGLNCEFCRQRVDVTPELMRLFSISTSNKIYDSPGCQRCAGTGIAGRRGIFETMPFNQQLKDELKSQALQRQTSAPNRWPASAATIRNMLIMGEISPPIALRALGVNPALLGYSDG